MPPTCCAATSRPHVDDRYDDGFYRLPNRSSHQCFTHEDLTQTLRRVFAGELGAAGGAEREAVVSHYLSARDGPLASERIVALIEQVMGDRSTLPRPALAGRVEGWCRAAYRRWKKRLKGRKAGSQTALEFHRHRYPPLSLGDVEVRLARLQGRARIPRVGLSRW